MKTIIIAAVAENNAIGKDNNLIWKLPNDMKFFKEKTSGHVVITGRKNYQSIPEKFRPLPNRVNLLITRNEDHGFGIPAFSSIKKAVMFAHNECSDDKDIYIIGGGEIYNQSLGLADEMFITKVKGSFDADVFFPVIDESVWNTEVIQTQEVDDKHLYAFEILHYTKK